MPDDFIRPIEVAITSSLKDIQETISHIEESLKSTSATIIAANEASQKSINDKNKKESKDRNKEAEDSANKINKANKQATEDNNKAREESADRINEKQKSTAEEIGAKLAGYGSKLTADYERLLRQYTDEQQKLSFNLIGSGMDYNTVRSALAVMGTNAFLKQNEVYTKLTNLVSSGITMNSTQRAYLQTAAEQVNLGFDSFDTNLNRLIQLHNQDLSEARVAQMAGLRTFLEDNYKNSQYIKQGFKQVSDALLEMQSIMATETAVATEKVIQTYLGAFTSAGGSKSSNIAQAIGQIGSGDFNLDSGMQNLMVMAASRAGLSYADLLTGGLDAKSSDALMQAVFSYIASMGGTGSNVAMNAMAKVFGVSVSDIQAAQNMKPVNVGNVNTDISQFFSDLANSTNMSTRMSNVFNNLMSSGALMDNMASYTLINEFSGILGDALQSAGEAQGVAGGQFLSLLGSGAKSLPTLNIMAHVLAGNSGLDLNNLFTLKNLKNLVTKGIPGIVGGIVDGFLGNSNSLVNDYFALDNIDNSSSFYSSGSFIGGRGGSSSSGTISNEDTNTPSIQITNEEEDSGPTFEDLYHLLADDYPTTTFSTVANIPHEINNDVFLADKEVTQYLIDMVTITAVSTENILMLLENSLGGANRTLIDMNALGLVNMWGD